MTYREYSRKNYIYRQRSRGQKPVLLAALPARSEEVQRLILELKARIGQEGYYQFSCRFPIQTVKNDRTWAAAIRAELWKLDHEQAVNQSMFACKQCTTAEESDANLP